MVELKDLIVVPNIADRLRPPVKSEKVLGPHKESWCEFHEAFGHHINNCLALGYQLDELVKNGFLKDYLVGSTATPVTATPEEGQTQKLLSAGHIREIQYPKWLANVVLVKKANGKWRMCVDFTDLNKACPKDSYPLPNIDALVDNASGCRMLSFLDAFSGYNEIKMHPRDKSKMAFMIETCSYCYKVMSFGLKNAGATYQRLVDKVLAPMLGRNVQAYVDDMVVTSHERGHHAADLEELPYQSIASN